MLDKHLIRDAGLITFTSTVDRNLVHRQSLSEVFLTNVAQVDSDRFICGSQWPRRHVFYRTGADMDAMLVAETLRQLTILIAHHGYGVPMDHSFLMGRLDVSIVDLPASGRGMQLDVPLNLSISVNVTDLRRSSSSVSGYRTSTTFSSMENVLARGEAVARILPAKVYRRLRAGTKPADHSCRNRLVHASDVGHDHQENVVIEQQVGEGVWPIHCNTDNPILFDHPLDHVPGMLILESVRQATRMHLGRTVDFRWIESKFTRIIELGAPSEVHIEEIRNQHGERIVTSSIVQNGSRAATVEAGLR